MITLFTVIGALCSICVALILVYTLLAFVIMNKEQANISAIIAYTIIGLIVIATSMAVNNAKLELEKDESYESGISDGYDSAFVDIRDNITISTVGMNSISLEFPNGEIDNYEFSFLPETEQEKENFGLVKTYEDYSYITSPTAPQTALNRLKTVYTDSNGLRRINDYYLCALGSFYGNIGDIFEVTLSSGRIMLVIKGDTKSDLHTDSEHKYQATDGSVLEFIVDSSILKSKLGSYGDVSKLPGFEGYITNIKLVGHYNF